MSSKYDHLMRIARLTFFVVTPIIFLLLPIDFFDTGTSICPSKLFFNIECLGCGMTRAVMHLIHFDFDSALYYNSGSLVVGPVLAGFWVYWTYNAYKALRPVPQSQ